MGARNTKTVIKQLYSVKSHVKTSVFSVFRWVGTADGLVELSVTVPCRRMRHRPSTRRVNQ